MLHTLRDDRALITEALACLDAELHAGRLDPDARTLQAVALPSGGRLLVGRVGRCAVAALRRAEPAGAVPDDPAEGEAVVASFTSAQSGRRNLAAFMIRLLALQLSGASAPGG